MRERIATIGPIAAVAGAFGLCCGLPLLLSMGVVGAVAGWFTAELGPDRGRSRAGVSRLGTVGHTPPT